MLLYRATLLLQVVLLGVCGTSGQLSFTEPQYTSSVPEALPPPLNVLTVQCTDSQSNSSGIEYSIPINLPFSIGANNGGITLTSPLDYETTTEYNFQATCSDQTLSTSVLVTINVLPVNEERPQPVGSQALFAAISESTEPGTVIASTEPGGLTQYRVTDSDTGPGNTIYYTVDDIPAEYAENFVFNESVGAIIFNSSIDLDIVGPPLIFLVLQIRVCDQQPPASDCPNFEVSVTYSRANDEAPVITPEDLTATAPEDSLINATLIEFICTDGDIGPGSTTTVDFYVLSPPNTSNNTFRLQTLGDQSTLFLAMPLNREAVESYIIAVSCTDGEFEAVADITVTVTDVNDNTPVLPSIPQPVQVSTAADIGTVVLAVECSDADAGSNADIRYSLSSPVDSFEILDPAVGNVSVRNSLALPLLVTYVDQMVTLSCQDNGFPSFTVETTITIRIFRPDLIMPNFTSGPEIAATAREDLEIGEDVTTITAIDPDSNDVFYSLSPASSVFEIDRFSGVITLVARLDREATDSYTLTVLASEERIVPGMARTSTAQLTITVTDINDNEPSCEEVGETDLDSISYAEFLITTLNCSDRDIGANGALIYSINSNTLPSLSNGQLSINQDTGELTLNGRFPNRLAQYAILVQVSDRGSPPLSTTVAVVLQVTPAGVELYVIIVPIVLILVFLCALGLVIGLCCCYCCWYRKRRRDTTYVIKKEAGRKGEGPLDAIVVTEKYPALREDGRGGHTAIELQEPRLHSEDLETQDDTGFTESSQPQVTVEVDERSITPEKQNLVVVNPSPLDTTHDGDESQTSEQEFRLTFGSQDPENATEGDATSPPQSPAANDTTEGDDLDTTDDSQGYLLDDDVGGEDKKTAKGSGKVVVSSSGRVVVVEECPPVASASTGFEGTAL